MHVLGIDIETYSSVSLMKSGIHKYVDSPDFEVMLLSWCLDDGPVMTFDLTREQVPTWFTDMLFDEDILKTAHNAQFEITCLSKFCDELLETDQWECTAIRGTMLGYPLSLDQMSQALKLEAKKDARGKALIKFFSVPNKDGTRNHPISYRSKWQQYVEYNRQDVYVEQQIRREIEWFKITDRERRTWLLDQKINKTGIRLDPQFVEQAITLNKATAYRLVEEAKEITGLANPNSVAQLKVWLNERTGRDLGALTKDNIKILLEDETDDIVRRVLQIRQELAKSSVKKYEAMAACCGSENRARGLLQFYGANKTGRWSSRLIQVQNLPQNKMQNLELARDLVRTGDFESMEMLFENIPVTMSQLIRTAFVADDGKELLITDFSAIEARVIAWFANEIWRLEVFKGHGKIYEASGAQMFKIPIEQVVKDVRAKAKVAELALGYQGSVGAMEKMGAIKMGLKQEELLPIVRLWRKANPNIVALWYAVQEKAIEAVENPGRVVYGRYLAFQVKNNVLFIKLPSGRCLTYINPKLKEGKYGTVITFYGVDQKTKKWVREDTYGGKLVENIVQGTARDLLADAMIRLDNLGYKIVMHVHDEVVMEIDKDDEQAVKKINKIMGQEILWAPGLPLAAESFTSPFYKKD